MSAVDHPEHYGKGKDDPYETIKVIRAWSLGFSLGNCIKYISRAGKKPGQSRLQDLHKALWYLQEEIAQEEKACINDGAVNKDTEYVRSSKWAGGTEK